MVSLALTHYNRFEMVTKAISQVIEDPRISDIIIMDDCSTDGSYEKLREFYKGILKVRVLRNARNLGMSRNKAEAISHARNEWVIIFDSDNTIDPNYLTALDRIEKFDELVIYCPSFARPQFDYRKWSGQFIRPEEVRKMGSGSMLECHLNTCNYVVNRDKYTKVYEHNPDIKETDTLYFAYLWMRMGGSFYIVPDMEYNHLVHDESGWLKNADYNMRKGKEIVNLIQNLPW